MSLRFDVIFATLTFWLIFGTFVVLGDTGLYMAAWHRSLLADAQRQASYNSKLVTVFPYTAFDDLATAENDDLHATNTKDGAAANTFDRQTPHDYGRSFVHMESNYKGCEELRKMVRLINTNDQVGMTMQQILADQTLNFTKCILQGRLIP